MRDRFGQITTPTAQHCPLGYYYDPAKGVCVPYTVPRTSVLALDMLKLSMRENSAALQKAGISDPLARPAAGTKLYYTVHDLIENFAVALLRQSVPFYYKTVTGEGRAVQSSTQANAAIDYLPQTIKLWGYVRTTDVPQPDPELPLHLLPVELDYEYPPSEQIEEEKVKKMAVSYALQEAGYSSYPTQGGRGRIAVSQESFDSLVSRARYIADAMVAQNTLSPRL